MVNIGYGQNLYIDGILKTICKRSFRFNYIFKTQPNLSLGYKYNWEVSRNFDKRYEEGNNL